MVRALQGQEETFEMYFRMKPPMFPAATLPFPSAGDLRFRAQGMWVARIPRVSLVSLALPWARFLLPLWGVHVQMHFRAVAFYDNKDNEDNAIG